jgi:hypothetical protein
MVAAVGTCKPINAAAAAASTAAFGYKTSVGGSSEWEDSFHSSGKTELFTYCCSLTVK